MDHGSFGEPGSAGAPAVQVVHLQEVNQHVRASLRKVQGGRGGRSLAGSHGSNDGAQQDSACDISIYLCKCTDVHIPIFTRLHICISIDTYVYIYVFNDEYMHVCACARVGAHVILEDHARIATGRIMRSIT